MPLLGRILGECQAGSQHMSDFCDCSRREMPLLGCILGECKTVARVGLILVIATVVECLF